MLRSRLDSTRAPRGPWPNRTIRGVRRIDRGPREEFDTPPDLRGRSAAAAARPDPARPARRTAGWTRTRWPGGCARAGCAAYTAASTPSATAGNPRRAGSWRPSSPGRDASLAIGRRARSQGSCAGTGGRIDETVRGPAVRSRPGIRFHRVAFARCRGTSRGGTASVHHARARDPRDRAAALRRRLKRVVRQAQAERVRERRTVRGRPAPRQRSPRRAGDRRDHRHRPRADRQRPRGRRARPDPGGRPRASGRRRAARRQRLLPARPALAGPAPQPRDRQQPLARRPVRPGARRGPPSELEATGERVLRTTREQARQPRQLVTRLLAAGAPRARGKPGIA